MRALVGPLLEYGAKFWSQTKQLEIKRLEKVQAPTTELVPSIQHKVNQRRLADLGLFTLLIETF